MINILKKGDMRFKVNVHVFRILLFLDSQFQESGHEYTITPNKMRLLQHVTWSVHCFQFTLKNLNCLKFDQTRPFVSANSIIEGQVNKKRWQNNTPTYFPSRGKKGHNGVGFLASPNNPNLLHSRQFGIGVVIPVLTFLIP